MKHFCVIDASNDVDRIQRVSDGGNTIEYSPDVIRERSWVWLWADSD